MNAPRTPPLEEPGPIVAETPADAALWYQDAVIYQLNVKAFFDSNGDGMGDFEGLTSKLDYVKDLGVNTLWLMPFYPSPLKDDGYDIADYLGVHAQYGTLDDFRRMLAEAHKRELKVITELVINHTSDLHPWFQAARRAPPGSPERDFYVWSDSDTKYAGTRIIFTDAETSNWTWDPLAKAYFWHRFFSHQPDLNFDSPLVLEAIFRTMRFWLDMGVDGFRLDAIPYLVEREGTNNENLPETHAVIKKLRAAIDASYKNRFLLAEANQWPEDVREYFGEGDECHAAYHFPLMPRMYMAIAQEDRFPLVEIMQQTPDIPANCQWAIFLRNHDELTLEMVTSKERDYMYTTYAADPRARINLGIRRRLAPLMENDMDSIKLMNSLLLSMRGSPIIYYGDELGMGDNVFVGDRNGVRTPMQWSPDRNAGFSRADPQRLYLPPIMDAVYGYEAVNVEAQLREPSSLLNWMRRLLTVRQSSRAFGRGDLLFLKPGNRKIFAYLRMLGDEAILCVANLARSAQPVELDLAQFKGRVPVELLGRTAFPPIGDLPYLLTIAAHGFYWFRLSTDVSVPSWHQDYLAVEDRPVLVLFDGWNSLFRDHVVPWRIGMAVKTRTQFETDTVPAFIESQRWYDAKGTPIKRARLADSVVWEEDGRSWLLPLIELDASTGPSTYFMPLALAWEDRDEERYRVLSTAALARVRQQAEVGVMADAFADESFCRAWIAAIGAGKQLPTESGSLRFTPTSVFAELASDDLAQLPVDRPRAQSSNTIVTVGERLFLKGYRRLRAGLNPEFEVGRFLTEVAHFPNCVPVAGVVEYTAADGSMLTLALLQAHISNQGDGWAYTLDYLQRYLEQRRTSAEAAPPDVHGAYLALAATLGQRTAELHLALARKTGNPAFDPEPLAQGDIAAYRAQAGAEAQATLALLESRLGQLSAAAADDARALLGAKARLLERIAQFGAGAAGGLKTRIHADYHLAQVLLTKNDFVIIDFEGEPGRSFDERRAKHSPLRDVAGMLRSFSYASASGVRGAATTPDELLLLAPLAAAWESETRGAFLQAYAGAVKGSTLYESFDGEPGLLSLFELEKALYELRYELNNRPDWVRIPLAGISGLLARP
ncbi:MAG TPA: maltose alpha-D-glucosyltransferase [Rhizobacter sp.]|nr:maltose alpha-D-glucosyltransferase [Rhizobacter sp.]